MHQHCYTFRSQLSHRRLAVLFAFLLEGFSNATTTSYSRRYPTLAFTSGTSRRDSRSFAFEKLIPSIARVTTFANSTVTIPHSGLGDPIPVLYTNSPNIVYKWLSDNLPSKGCTLGFDVESVPEAPWMKGKTLYSGPATVQLSTLDAALVIQLTRPNGIPSQACSPILEAVLKDESFVKAGVGCDQDMLDLHRWCNGALEARSRFELGAIGTSNTKGSLGLKALAKSILGVDLVKSRRLAMSNWSQVPLTDAQLAYCARDAWAGAAIMATLAEYDPETFGTRNVVKMLQSQRPLRELNARSLQRKSAKVQLADLLSPYRMEQQKPVVSMDTLPSGIRQRVEHLNDIMKELAPEKRSMFDIERLGFRLD